MFAKELCVCSFQTFVFTNNITLLIYSTGSFSFLHQNNNQPRRQSFNSALKQIYIFFNFILEVLHYVLCFSPPRNKNSSPVCWKKIFTNLIKVHFQITTSTIHFFYIVFCTPYHYAPSFIPHLSYQYLPISIITVPPPLLPISFISYYYYTHLLIIPTTTALISYYHYTSPFYSFIFPIISFISSLYSFPLPPPPISFISYYYAPSFILSISFLSLLLLSLSYHIIPPIFIISSLTLLFASYLFPISISPHPFYSHHHHHHSLFGHHLFHISLLHIISSSLSYPLYLLSPLFPILIPHFYLFHCSYWSAETHSPDFYSTDINWFYIFPAICCSSGFFVHF